MGPLAWICRRTDHPQPSLKERDLTTKPLPSIHGSCGVVIWIPVILFANGVEQVEGHMLQLATDNLQGWWLYSMQRGIMESWIIAASILCSIVAFAIFFYLWRRSPEESDPHQSGYEPLLAADTHTGGRALVLQRSATEDDASTRSSQNLHAGETACQSGPLLPGDHVFRTGAFRFEDLTHHGIYVGKFVLRSRKLVWDECEEHGVIDTNGTPGRVYITRTRLDMFCEGGAVSVAAGMASDSSGALASEVRVRLYDEPLRRRPEIIKEALYRLGAKFNYEVLSRNCESFACLCTTGRYFTSQGRLHGSVIRSAFVTVFTVVLFLQAARWQGIFATVLAAVSTVLVNAEAWKSAQVVLMTEAALALIPLLRSSFSHASRALVADLWSVLVILLLLRLCRTSSREMHLRSCL